jgi:hypothetical protein
MKSSQPALANSLQAAGVRNSNVNLVAPTLATQITIPQAPASTVVRPNSTKGVLNKTDPVQKYGKLFKLKGQLEITGGLAFTGNGDFINIFRQVGNASYETGDVWIREGKYEIQINEPYGLLVAELRHATGELVGRGEIWIEDIQGMLAGTPQETDLTIEPAIAGHKGQVISAYSFDDYSDPVGTADVEVPGLDQSESADTKGHFKMADALFGSSFMVRAKKKGYWGGLTLATNLSTYNITMYPDKMIQALYDLVGRPEGLRPDEFEQSGIIWGRITHKGKPLAGTKVELADGAAFGPIYFNSLHIPDRKLEETSGNGLFVFLKAQPGINVIRAINGEKALPSKVLVVDYHHATHVTIEAAQKRVADVYVRDAVDGKPLVSQVRFVGAPKAGQTSSQGSIRLRYTFANDPLFIEVDSGENYVESRISTHRRARFINIPQVSKDWLNTIVRKLPVVQQVGTGTIVGFIENKNFVTYLDRDDNEYAQVFYFDNRGEIVPSGVAGGGFIMVNVQPGPRTVTLGGDRTVVPWTQVTLVDSDFLSVINHQF